MSIQEKYDKENKVKNAISSNISKKISDRDPSSTINSNEKSNFINRRQFLSESFPLLRKITNKRMTNNSKFFLKTLIDNKLINKQNNTVNMVNLNKKISSKSRSIVDKDTEITKNTLIPLLIIENLNKKPEVLNREMSDKDSYILEKRKFLEMKKNNFKFKSLINDKFFLNKISSFYGIREHKINKVEPQETRIFNLTYLNPIHNSTLGSIESNNPKLSSKTQFKMDFQSRNINNFHSNSVKKISFLNSKN